LLFVAVTCEHACWHVYETDGACRLRQSRGEVEEMSWKLSRQDVVDEIIYFWSSPYEAKRPSIPLRPHRRTSWKLVANPGWQTGFPTSLQPVANMPTTCRDRSIRLSTCSTRWQVAGQVECRKLPGLQEVANFFTILIALLVTYLNSGPV